MLLPQGSWMYDNLNPKLPAKLVDVTPWVKTKVWPSRTMAPLTPIAVPPQAKAIASQKTPPLKKKIINWSWGTIPFFFLILALTA